MRGAGVRPVHAVCGDQHVSLLLSHLSVCLDLGAVVCRAAVGVCTRRAALPRPPAARALRSRWGDIEEMQGRYKGDIREI